MKTILHATDFSPSSTSAFAIACSLARQYGAKLIVLHVIPPVLTSYPPAPPEWRQAEVEQLKRIQAPDPQIRLGHRVEEGEPAKEM